MTVHEETLPLFSESVVVSKRKVDVGTVKVRVSAETHDETVPILLSNQEVVVERVPVGCFVEIAPEVRVVDGVTIIPVLEERAVVTVRLFLREEMHVRSVTTTHESPRTISLRRETATVERLEPQQGGTSHE